MNNDIESSEIPFGEKEDHNKEEKGSEDDMSSSSSNHWASGRGRSARTRRTDLLLTYTIIVVEK